MMLHASDAAIIFTCYFFYDGTFFATLFSHVRDSDNEDSLSAVIHIIIIGIEQRALGSLGRFMRMGLHTKCLNSRRMPSIIIFTRI